MHQPLWAGLGIVGAIALALGTPTVIAAEVDLNLLSNSAFTSIQENGVHINIIEPQLAPDRVVIAIPRNIPGASFSENYQVVLENTLSTPMRYVLPTIVRPELLTSDGQALQPQITVNDHLPESLRCWTAAPGDGFFVEAGSLNLSWYEDKLRLSSNSIFQPSSSWFFDDLQPGAYHLRLTYSNTEETNLTDRNVEEQCCEPQTGELTEIKDTAVAQGVSPFLNLRLVQPLLNQPNAIEVDGVRFEALVPEDMLDIDVSPANYISSFDRPAGVPVRYGIHVTNLTEEPIRFSQFGTVYPNLIAPDGQALRRGGGNDALAAPKPQDFPLVSPGESFTYFLEGVFYWRTEEDERSGINFWTANNEQWFTFYRLVFDSGRPQSSFAQPGVYQLQLSYHNTQLLSPYGRLSSSNELGENAQLPLWVGSVYMPSVEINLHR